MNTSQKCNCCIHEAICGNKDAYQAGVMAILEATFMVDDSRYAIVKSASCIEVNIKCPHMIPNTQTRKEEHHE